MEEDSIMRRMYKQIVQDKKSSPEYSRALNKYSILKETFSGKLSKKQKRELNVLLDLRNNMNEIEYQEFFIEGFSLASQIMIEVLYKRKKK